MEPLTAFFVSGPWWKFLTRSFFISGKGPEEEAGSEWNGPIAEFQSKMEQSYSAGPNDEESAGSELFLRNHLEKRKAGSGR
jgi:hypothetical protein